MSFLSSLITLPDSRLRQPSERVSFKDEYVKQLSERMKATILEWEETRPYEIGAALSAIQIAEPYRVVIIRENDNDKNDQSFLTLLNPEILKIGGKVEADYEGCLSIVDIYGLVPRRNKVTIGAMSLEGKKIKIEAEGFMARVLQHEIDHTNGVVFIDHIRKEDAFYYLGQDGNFQKIPHREIIKSKTLWADN